VLGVAVDRTAVGLALVRYLAGSARPELPNIAIRGATISAAFKQPPTTVPV
jgi:hypothetical protein